MLISTLARNNFQINTLTTSFFKSLSQANVSNVGLINIEHWDKSSRQAELSVVLVGSIVAENSFHQKNQIVYKESFLVTNEDRAVKNHCESHFYSFIHAFWCFSK